MSKPPSEVPTEELDDGFTVVTATLRGTKYVVHEMTAADYQKCVDGAKEKDPDTGFERTNQDVLARLMLDKSIIEPKGMNVADIMKKPTTVVFKLNSIVTEMHYAILETDEEKADEEKAEGEAKG